MCKREVAPGDGVSERTLDSDSASDAWDESSVADSAELTLHIRVSAGKKIGVGGGQGNTMGWRADRGWVECLFSQHFLPSDSRKRWLASPRLLTPSASAS